MTKAELRKIYLAKQRSLSSETRTENSQRISGQFFHHSQLDQIKVLHCFIAIEKFNEIDTTLIFQRLWREFPQMVTVVPRVDLETGEMRNLKFTPETSLVKNIWGIHEPSHDEFVETADIDMVLAPLLCFDKAGHRVGYGKGFYDRFLKGCREDCVKIGLSYFPPVEEIEDAGEWDIKLDFCLTPSGILHATKKKERG
ncbi:MAG: 5-formyltetrahydrofolate cyclo-ligase [Saprospiraceae bacterium]|nr:5-formyltetrahydrofolate cyclo-ligase [Pyrinomonadaceae bacterium]